jgi:DHA1 family tetracycline resistance protein-like MFS transporter
MPDPIERTIRHGREAAMPFILVTVLIDMMSIGLIVPVLPALVGELTGTKTDQALWYGVVTIAFSFANFIGAPILGALSDSYALLSKLAEVRRAPRV